MSFPMYPEYRESGLGWLGALPAHWTMLPLWTLFRRVKRTGFPDEELLSVYRDYGVILKSDRDDNFNKPSEDLATYQLVEPGDLAVNKMKAWQGSVGISSVRGIVSPAYHVYEAQHSEHSRFLHFLMRSGEYTAGYLSLSKGIRVNQWDLEPQYHSRMPVLLPPLEEQRAIAAFLDRETAKIDALVEAQRRLIALLKEKRQAVISHAATQGLNPAAPMKDSGIEWLGQIPAHWEVKRLKHIVSFRSGNTPSKENLEFWDGDIPWASAKDLKSDELYDTIDHISSSALQNGGAQLQPVDSVVVLVRGMMLAKTFPVTVLRVPLAINQDLKALIPHHRLTSEYLAAFLRGSSSESLNRLEEAGHGTKALRMEKWSSLEVPLPPLIEQKQIVAHLSERLREIDELVNASEHSILLMQERRAALISAAVTGKIDVRGLAPVVETQPAAWVRDQVSAQIISLQAHQPTFGRVKFQKQVYLAETHAGVHEIGGRYVREAAGPYDRELIASVEENLKANSFMTVKQEVKGAAVTYHPKRGAKVETEALSNALGDRAARLAHVIDTTKDLKTADIEAVATLYAVWNDFLIDGAAVTDDRIISGVLKEWHPEKASKFTKTTLQQWLNWMRKQALTPSGQGPRTQIGDLL